MKNIFSSKLSSSITPIQRRIDQELAVTDTGKIVIDFTGQFDKLWDRPLVSKSDVVLVFDNLSDKYVGDRLNKTYVPIIKKILENVLFETKEFVRDSAERGKIELITSYPLAKVI